MGSWLTDVLWWAPNDIFVVLSSSRWSFNQGAIALRLRLSPSLLGPTLYSIEVLRQLETSLMTSSTE